MTEIGWDAPSGRIETVFGVISADATRSWPGWPRGTIPLQPTISTTDATPTAIPTRPMRSQSGRCQLVERRKGCST